jgi:hypothetical protein
MSSLEATQAARIAGRRTLSGTERIEIGPWDHELCDPEWSASGYILLPLGPWAEGMAS